MAELARPNRLESCLPRSLPICKPSLHGLLRNKDVIAQALHRYTVHSFPPTPTNPKRVMEPGGERPTPAQPGVLMTGIGA